MKRNLICVLLVAFICAAAFISVPISKGRIASAQTDIRPVIIVDAGHGGFDGGAVALDGTVEKDINLQISLFLGALLKQEGFDVVFTRESDTGTDDDSTQKIARRKKSDLQNRLALMEKYPDSVFVSIHLNKFTTSAASGAQVFYSKNNDNSRVLGEYIQKSIIGLIQPENTRVIKQATSSTFLLNNATVPAIIVECGFLSNQKDLSLLKTEEYQKKMAFSVFCGIKEFYSKE